MATITDITTLIVHSPETCGDSLWDGKAECPRITGTRISVQQIATLHKQGLSATDIIAEYEFLNLAQVYASLAYYYANEAEIEADLADEEAVYDRLLTEQTAV